MVANILTSKDMVLQAIKNLKNEKSKDHNQITGEMMENMGRKSLELLTELFYQKCKESKIPQHW